MARALVGAGLTLAVAAPAGAGTVYRWRTDDGTLAYTNIQKQIPERYRAKAEVVQLGSLHSYKRYTPQGAAGTQSHARAVSDNLARLRALNASLDREEMLARRGAMGPGARPPARGALGGVLVGPDGSTSYYLGGHPSHEPVVVEQVRYRVPDSEATRIDTIVRQGDRTILVVKPQKNQVGLDSEQLPDESELETGD
jgi:hypothetical protein